jgi:hypothetical protein
LLIVITIVINKNPFKMKRIYLVWVVLTGVTLLVSCGRNGSHDLHGAMVADNKIFQQQDGTISLNLKMADCYQDVVNPASNTAEWNVVVSRKGRYDIWLSSATKDTTDLDYKNSVLLSIRDNRFEAVPTVSRVVQKSTEVSEPYFQADSYLGTLYIQDTGVYNVQVISDRILPESKAGHGPESDAETKILAVSLTPATVKH